MLTLNEVCRILTITRGTAYKLLRDGNFPISSVRIGDQHRFSPTLVNRYLNGGNQ